MRSLLGISAGLLVGRLMEAAVEGAEGGATTETAPTKAKSEVEKVVMEDQRVVEFVGKRKMLKDIEFPEGGTPVVVLDFRNGKTIRSQIPQELLHQAAGHGWSQKLGDETAGCDDVEDMYLAVEELDKRLRARNEDGSFAGQWNTKREGGGMSGTSMLLKALVEVSGKTVDEVKAFLTGRTATEKLAMRNSPKVKPTIDRLEAEKAAKAGKVDTDALLGQLAG